ncbi:MAG: hypothetical protein KDB82_02985 [Planctomycetes bacterium]|nr:hypothetical protein [Planctomycetota bacterium]
MSGKRGFAIGLLLGVIFGLVGNLVTLHFTTAELDKRQADAYDKGYKDGVERASKDGIDISGRLNRNAVQQTNDLRNQLDSVKTQLQALQGRDDMSPQAKDQVEVILEGLK